MKAVTGEVGSEREQPRSCGGALGTESWDTTSLCPLFIYAALLATDMSPYGLNLSLVDEATTCVTPRVPNTSVVLPTGGNGTSPALLLVCFITATEIKLEQTPWPVLK